MDKHNYRKMIFPPPERADEDGIVAISHELNTDMLLEAYSRGIFPWPVNEDCVLWFSPAERAVLLGNEFVVSSKVKREISKRHFTLTVNQQFDQVIDYCATVERSDGTGTWITEKIIKSYQKFNRQGYALSFETLNDRGELVGGLYGIKMGRYFAGESMFYLESGASKFALIKTVEYLKNTFGIKWFDGQVLNPFLARFGFKEIPRRNFLKLLKDSLT